MSTQRRGARVANDRDRRPAPRTGRAEARRFPSCSRRLRWARRRPAESSPRCRWFPRDTDASTRAAMPKRAVPVGGHAPNLVQAFYTPELGAQRGRAARPCGPRLARLPSTNSGVQPMSAPEATRPLTFRLSSLFGHLELIIAILLGVVSIATAYASFQAALYDSQMAGAYATGQLPVDRGRVALPRGQPAVHAGHAGLQPPQRAAGRHQRGRPRRPGTVRHALLPGRLRGVRRSNRPRRRSDRSRPGILLLPARRRGVPGLPVHARTAT